MNAKPFALRIAAVVCSLLLLGGYVYERAVGGLLPKWGAAKPAEQEMLPGSKSKSVQLWPGSEQPQVFPGPKSAVLVEPATGEAEPSTTLLPGSKSLIIAEPAPPTPVTPQPAQTLLPGSKSAMVITPEEPPVQQPVTKPAVQRPQ